MVWLGTSDGFKLSLDGSSLLCIDVQREKVIMQKVLCSDNSCDDWYEFDDRQNLIAGFPIMPNIFLGFHISPTIPDLIWDIIMLKMSLPSLPE